MGGGGGGEGCERGGGGVVRGEGGIVRGRGGVVRGGESCDGREKVVRGGGYEKREKVVIWEVWWL